MGGSVPGKIFVNYRRDDERAVAARVRDRLGQTFGDANVFMDADNLLAGQRFDMELETDVFIAVIGPRWMELLSERQASGERDYVREEIAGALKQGITVIPVLVKRTPLPDDDALPEDIRELVLHQKHDVAPETLGRDVAGLVGAIKFARKAVQTEVGGPSRGRFAALAAVIFAAGMLAYVVGAPMLSARPDPWDKWEGQAAKAKEAEVARAAAEKARQEEAKKAAQEAEHQRLAMLKGQEDAWRAEEEKKRALWFDAQTKSLDQLYPHRPPEGVFRDCADCPEMVVVPAGTFMMGSPSGEPGWLDSEGPQRKVTIARPFAVGKFEVTFAEWDACAAAGGCKHQPGDEGWGRGRRPVINVSWHDAKEYAAWLSHTTGKTYRLLSEAEWEYAARAGTTTRYAFGDMISKSQAQYSEGFAGSAGKTVEVGSFLANRFGLHDMHGNVWEWCEDGWHPDYHGGPIDGSVWSGGDASLLVLRGGSWLSWGPEGLRSAYRGRNRPESRYDSVGFRLFRAL